MSNRVDLGTKIFNRTCIASVQRQTSKEPSYLIGEQQSARPECVHHPPGCASALLGRSISSNASTPSSEEPAHIRREQKRPGFWACTSSCLALATKLSVEAISLNQWALGGGKWSQLRPRAGGSLVLHMCLREPVADMGACVVSKIDPEMSLN